MTGSLAPTPPTATPIPRNDVGFELLIIPIADDWRRLEFDRVSDSLGFCRADRGEMKGGYIGRVGEWKVGKGSKGPRASR